MLHFPGQALPGQGTPAVRTSGKAVRLRNPPDGPPLPLAEEHLEQIRNLIRDNGGVVHLGKICHDFLGLKKAQLEGHFRLTRVGDQWEVRLPPELEEGGLFDIDPRDAAAMNAAGFAGLGAGADTGLFAGGLDGLSAGLGGLHPELQPLGAPAAHAGAAFAADPLGQGLAQGLGQGPGLGRDLGQDLAVDLSQSWSQGWSQGLQGAAVGQGIDAGLAVTGSPGLVDASALADAGLAPEAASGAAAAAAEAPPLEPAHVEAIAMYLEQHGGALPLGRVTQHFRNLKRSQLEAYFELSQVGSHGQWEVRLPGMESQGAEMIFQGRAVPMDTPLPPLTEQQLSDVRNLLAMTPGQTLPFLQVVKSVPGIKRRQLEEHFQVLQIDKKRFDISLHGLPGRVDTRKSALAPAPADAFAAAAPPALQPPALLAAPEPQEPPPPLDGEAIGQVTQLLEAFGGETWMGKVSQTFKHIKRQQLEGYFDFQRVGDQWLVRLPGLASAATSETVAASLAPVAAVKQLLGTGSAAGAAPAGLDLNVAAPPPAPRLAPALPAASALPPLKAPPSGHGLHAGAFRGPVGSAAPAARPHAARAVPLVRSQAFAGQPGMQLRAQQGYQSMLELGKNAAKEPPPPLAPEVLEGIMSLVELEGGACNMGRISQAFIGVKRAQLEGHFEMSRDGDQLRISLPAVKRRRVV